MSFGGVFRRGAFWSKDRIINRSGIRKQYEDIKKIIENYEKGAIIVNKYIDDILTHATKTTRFYKIYEGKAFNDFPVVDKTKYLSDYDAFISSSYRDKKLHTMSTSGSTGTPFTILQNSSKRDRVIAELKLFGEYCGYRSHEKMVFLRILSENTRKNKLTEWLENIYRVDVSSLSIKRLSEINNLLIQKKISAIISYGSTFDYLADYIEKHQSSRYRYCIKTIIAGGEAINPKTRESLSNIFGEKCNIVSRYSNQEMGILGQDWSVDSGFKLNCGSYFFECLKLGSNEPVDEGEIGRIVITDLHNYAFPLIRYDTGDTGIIEYISDGWPRIKEIYGKHRDVIFNTKGEPVSPAIMSVYMWKAKGINQYQLIQDGEKQYILKINGVSEIGLDKVICNLKLVLGEDAEIVVENVEEIPVMQSSKRRYTVCNLNRNNSSDV